jgi:phosphoglucosamine mutase
MGVLFGTDGIRGIAGTSPLDRDTIYRAGYSLTRFLRPEAAAPHILIARDTRISGLWIQELLERAIRDAQGIPELCGVLSTPAVSHLTTATGAQAGIMISASHNPYQDNGIKIFASTGMKFMDAVENELEEHILSSTLQAPDDVRASEPEHPDALLVDSPQYHSLYTEYLRTCLPAHFSLRGVKLVLDCANGALSAIAPEFFAGIGASVLATHCEPTGRNINLDCGALHLDCIRSKVLHSGAALGIAFDGDADRVMFVDSCGRVHDGDDVLFLFAKYLEFPDSPRTVVGTVMANLGLEVALESIGFGLARTAVGDRYVLEELLRSGAAIGGEQSGHVILTRLARTGDGLLTALKLLQLLQEQQEDIAVLTSGLQRFPQLLLNVRVREKVPFESIPGLRAAEDAAKEKLGARSRILLRYSGTEKLARVMVEGEKDSAVQEAAAELAACFEKL